jgi:hypothetical protein
MFRPALALFLLSVLAVPARAESLPVVAEVDWGRFRGHCQTLLAGLEKLGAPLPAETAKPLRALLKNASPTRPDEAARDVQKLLDAHCLVGVTINPESRVKAARGPRRAELLHERPVYVLVKVHNDGGVTHAVAVASAQKALSGKNVPGRWLGLSVVDRHRLGGPLTGARAEYRVLELTARQSGKREATLAFDVGQGSQDLGFRAEVPILFTVRPR